MDRGDRPRYRGTATRPGSRRDPAAGVGGTSSMNVPIAGPARHVSGYTSVVGGERERRPEAPPTLVSARGTADPSPQKRLRTADRSTSVPARGSRGPARLRPGPRCDRPRRAGSSCSGRNGRHSSRGRGPPRQRSGSGDLPRLGRSGSRSSRSCALSKCRLVVRLVGRRSRHL